MFTDVSNSGEGIVHVINVKSKKKALALKNFSQVLDIQFCSTNTETFLATTTISNTFIHQIRTKNEIVECTLILELIERPVIVAPKFVKTIWCPNRTGSIDHPKSENLNNQWAIWIRGNSYLMYNLTSIIEAFGVSNK